MLPKSIQRSLPMTLLRARELVMKRFRPMLARHGITEQQWRVVRVLCEQGPLSASEAAERASILGPSLTRIIKTLEEAGLIVSERAAADGRRVVLEATPAGVEVIKSAAAERRTIYRDLEKLHGRQFIEDLLDRLETLIQVERTYCEGGAGDNSRAEA